MDNKKLTYLGIAGAVLIVVVGWIAYGNGIMTEEVEARSRVEAQQKLVEAHHDAMWKIVRCATA